MAHCNNSACTRSTHYDGDDRLCECPCETCREDQRGVVRPKPKRRDLCAGCSAPVGPDDEFCEACGKPVSDEAREAARMRVADEAVVRRRTSAFVAAKVTQASRVIGLLAALFVLGGVWQYALAHGQATKALANLASLPPEEVLLVAGKSYTVSELRAKVEAEPMQVLLLNLTLAAVMAGLFFWAKRKPLPAIATALTVYAAVVVVTVLLDPATIVQGIVVKVLAFSALGTGLKAALEARAAR